MHDAWLNHLILLYLYKKKIVKIDTRKIAKEFIARKDLRKERFSL